MTTPDEVIAEAVRWNKAERRRRLQGHNTEAPTASDLIEYMRGWLKEELSPCNKPLPWEFQPTNLTIDAAEREPKTK